MSVVSYDVDTATRAAVELPQEIADCIPSNFHVKGSTVRCLNKTFDIRNKVVRSFETLPADRIVAAVGNGSTMLVFRGDPAATTADLVLLDAASGAATTVATAVPRILTQGSLKFPPSYTDPAVVMSANNQAALINSTDGSGNPIITTYAFRP